LPFLLKIRRKSLKLITFIDLGVLVNGAEIKPFEPDPDHAGEGKAMLSAVV
jgi:hypothetical protein